MRIAITGGIAEGKSTVLDALRQAGVPVLSADEVARKVLGLPEVQARVGSELGLAVPLDRLLLRDRLGETDARRTMNRLLHPLVWAELQRFPHGAVEVPLLLEACLHPYFDRVWVVTCGPAEQRARLVARTQSEAIADRLLGTQLPTRAKIPFADLVVRTTEPVDRVTEYVWEQWRLSLQA